VLPAYRSKIRIYFDILRVLEDEGGKAKVTKLLYKANLSYNRLQRYLRKLEDSGLIEKDLEDNKPVYLLTRNGRRFIVEFYRIEEFLKAFGLAM